MEALLAGLLRAHAGAGGHALLLSATLCAGMRARLLGAPVPPLAEAENIAYPACAWAERGRERRQLIPPENGRGKTVSLEAPPWLDEVDAVARRALDAARQGAKGDAPPASSRVMGLYFRCWARCLFISNMLTLSLPNTARSLPSAMISRLLVGF